VEIPQIDHRGPVSPYQQIADWLRQRITAGELRPGQAIPSEKELVDLFGVARTTARRSVALLREEGLVRTVPQRGTYVTPPD
jgi:DNA-binding GntR family transcriptional regulator